MPTNPSATLVNHDFVNPDQPRFVVGKPSVLNRQKFLERVTALLQSGWHTNDGPLVKELEAFSAASFAVKHCVAVSNATAGLEILLQCSRIPKQSKVIVPSFTFVSTVHAVIRSDLEPVFCDVDERGMLDCDHLEQLMDDKTKAILAVNIFGFACDLPRLESIAEEKKLALFFDSAHGIGVSVGAKPLGGNGIAEVFSLHATKIVSGFEGGLIATNSDVLADELRLARNFGFAGYDRVISVGTNAKLSEIHAAMALTNFENVCSAIAHNKLIFETYVEHLDKRVQMIKPLAHEQSNYQYVAVRCPKGSRELILEHLLEQGVFARRYFYPGVHGMSPYKHMQVHLPHTEALCEQILCLPTGQDVSSADARMISCFFNDALNTWGH